MPLHHTCAHDRLDGQVESVDSVAYVAQQAWIQNATVKDNILFGKEMDWHRYNEIVCCFGHASCGCALMAM